MANGYGQPDFLTRVAIGALGLIVGLAGWHYFKPHTTFATDGRGTAWDQAVWRSQDRHQPVVVLFTARWCSACQFMHANVLSRSDVLTELDHFTYVTVDLTDWSGLAGDRAQKYGVNSIPTLIRFDADGRETDRVHCLPPDELIAWLNAGE